MDDITASIIVACQTDGAAAAVDKLGFSFAMLARNALNFGVKAVSEFRTTQDAAWKFGKTFRDSMGTAEKAVTEFMDEYNLSESTARSMLTDTAQILKGMGFAEKESLKVAESISRWGVDLASFTGYAGGAQGAVQAITASMMGENERLKSLGVVIREDADEFKDMTKEIMRTKGVSEQHAKALAKLQLITIKAKDAKGDYAAEGENFTQSVNNLNQQIKQVVSNFGEVIYHGLRLNDIFGNLSDGLKSVSKNWRTEKETWLYLIKDATINIEYSFKQMAVYMQPAIDAIGTLIKRFVAFGELLTKAPTGELLKAIASDLNPFEKSASIGEDIAIYLNRKKMHKKYGSDEDILVENLRRIDAGEKIMVEDEYNLEKRFGNNLQKLAEKFKVDMPQFKPLTEYNFDAELRRLLIDFERQKKEAEEAYGKALIKPKDKPAPPAEKPKEPEPLRDSIRALGSFSAADLNQKIAGTMSPAVKTATNTEKMATNTSKTVDLLKSILSKIPVVKALSPRQFDMGIPGTTPESQRSNSFAASAASLPAVKAPAIPPAVKALVSGEWRLPLPELPAVKALQQGVVPQTQETAVPMTAAAQIGIGSEAKPVKDILEVVKDQRALLKKMVQQPPQLTITYS